MESMSEEKNNTNLAKINNLKNEDINSAMSDETKKV